MTIESYTTNRPCQAGRENVMAYMTKSQGPYPNRAGEFCGNHRPGDDASANVAEWVSRMRFGRPRPEGGRTTAELEALGYVGCYLLKEASWSLNPKTEEECPTPPELTEPAAEGE